MRRISRTNRRRGIHGTGSFDCFGRAMANLIDIWTRILWSSARRLELFAIYAEGVPLFANTSSPTDLQTPIVKHQLGDSAGVLGAALIGI